MSDDPQKPDDEQAEGDGPHMVDCVKFGKRMQGLPKAPLKGEIGEKIYDNVSQEAWRMWLEHSKMLVNEFRLDLMSEAGQNVWFAELEKYFWGEGSQLPPDFEPMKSK
ncbi:MAG: oxidative damage protection protein [Polyangiaceae bacterium]